MIRIWKYPNEDRAYIFIKVIKFFIVVKDTGIGIPKEDQDRIFERFFCVDRSHTNKDSTGLGLTIVKHIVEECHGSIDVDSKLGEGTTFTLVFEMA